MTRESKMWVPVRKGANLLPCADVRKTGRPSSFNTNSELTATPNKTDAVNGWYGICRVSDASRAPSLDPTR
jgi:hypothetical protein